MAGPLRLQSSSMRPLIDSKTALIAAESRRRFRRPSSTTSTTSSLPLPSLPSSSRRLSSVVARAAEADLQSALAKIEKLEEENRRLRELLVGGGSGGDGGREEGGDLLRLGGGGGGGEEATATMEKPAPSSAAAAAPSASPPPTSMQFPAAGDESRTKKASSSPLPVESKDVVWPEPGEKFWERPPRKSSGGGKGIKVGAPSSSASSSSSDANTNDDFIVHIAAELAPSAKVGGLGDGEFGVLVSFIIISFFEKNVSSSIRLLVRRRRGR